MTHDPIPLTRQLASFMQDWWRPGHWPRGWDERGERFYCSCGASFGMIDEAERHCRKDGTPISEQLGAKSSSSVPEPHGMIKNVLPEELTWFIIMKNDQRYPDVADSLPQVVAALGSYREAETLAAALSNAYPGCDDLFVAIGSAPHDWTLTQVNIYAAHLRRLLGF